MVFMSMVLHHLDDPDRALEECRRVLRRGGTVCLRAGTVDRIGNYPYVRFFTRSGAILMPRRLPSELIRSSRNLAIKNLPRGWRLFANTLRLLYRTSR